MPLILLATKTFYSASSQTFLARYDKRRLNCPLFHSELKIYLFRKSSPTCFITVCFCLSDWCHSSRRLCAAGKVATMLAR